MFLGKKMEDLYNFICIYLFTWLKYYKIFLVFFKVSFVSFLQTY